MRKSAEEYVLVKAMSEAVNNPVLRALLGTGGGNLSELDSALARADKASSDLDAHWREVADFNHYFTERGWIYYDPMNLEFVKSVNAVAAGDDLDAAETMIVEHYDEKHLRFMLNLMKYVKAFQPRMARARQALEDHLTGRYDATVLALIPIIDGTVQDAHEKRRGFFAGGTDLTAWDSIVAHPQGLMELARIFSKTRPKTNTEPLTLPYRNGIVHGTDLNFGSRLVATKLWALLFTLRDWALKSERGELSAPPQEQESTLSESVAKLIAARQDHAAIDAWEPRGLEFGRDLPETGIPDLYEIGTPERALVTMLCAWQAKNYGAVRDCMVKAFREMDKKELFYRLRNWYINRPLSAFALQQFEREAPGAVDIVTILHFGDEPDQAYTVTFRVLCETRFGKISYEGVSDAHWGLLEWSPPIKSEGLTHSAS